MAAFTKEDLTTAIADAVKSGNSALVDSIKGQFEEALKNAKPAQADPASLLANEEMKAADLLPGKREWTQACEEKHGCSSKTAGLGMFMKSVHQAETTHNKNVHPLLQKTWEIQSKAQSTALGTIDSDAGGTLVPTEFRAELLQIGYNRSAVLGRVTNIPMSSSKIEIPALSGYDRSSGQMHGGIVFYWTEEGQDGTYSKPSTGGISLSLHDLVALTAVNNSLIQDSPISIGAFIQRAFGDGFAYAMDAAIVAGSGAGKPLGLLNAPCAISVAKETGQTAATFTFQNAIKMWTRLYDETDAVWLMNKSMIPQVAQLQLPAGAGGTPVIVMNAAAAMPTTLFGAPIVYTEHCKALGTVGDVILTSLSNYLLGTKAGQGMEPVFDTSMHVYFDANQNAFRFTFRVDGQPWWKSALTPTNGSTLSPIVTLATRA